MNAFTGLVKKAVYGLAHLPLCLGILCLAHTFVGGITALAGTGVYKNKQEKYVNDYKSSTSYFETVNEEYEKAKTAYETGALDDKQYNERRVYLQSDEYAKSLIEAKEDPTYNVILKKRHQYEMVSYSCIGSLVGALSGVLVGINLWDHAECFMDEGYWPWDEELKAERMQKKEEKKLDKIVKTEQEEELPEAKF